MNFKLSSNGFSSSQKRVSEVYQLWLKGLTLRGIASKVGLSHERIRQILRDVCPIEGAIHLKDLAKMIGIKRDALGHLIKIGKVKIETFRNYTFLKEGVVEAIQNKIFKCPICGRPKPSFRHKRCLICKEEEIRTRYSRYTPEQKLKHKALIYKWRERHPVRWLEIHRKAMRKYNIKRRRTMIGKVSRRS